MKNEAAPREDESTLHEGEAPEQTFNGAPGEIIWVPNAIYKIQTSLNTSSLVDMALKGNSNGIHNVKLYHNTDEPESTWSFEYYATNYLGYLIANRYNRLGLGVSTSDSAIASPITMSQWQLWVLKDAGAGFVYLENKYDGKVMDVRGSNTADDTNIIVYPYHGTANQKFKLIKVRDL